MDWKSVYLQSRPHVLRGSRLRAFGVGGIGAFLLLVWGALGRVDLWFVAAAGVVAVVLAAFVREARENARLPPLVLIGKVVDKGLRKFTDSGGPTDAAATRMGVSPRITIAVREAFDLAADGTRTPRPDEQKDHVIEQLRWYRTLEAGDEVVLVCLPKSTDPVYRVPPQ